MKEQAIQSHNSVIVKFFTVVAASLLTSALHADTPRSEADLRRLPATTGNDAAAKLVQKWFAERTAAGNIGDWYDNRDRKHSHLRMDLFPQLQKVQYTDEQLKRRMDWALNRWFIRPHVTVGNSSTAAPATRGGSNARQATFHAQLAAVHYKQYRANNLYIYPEHRDCDPGHNGRGGGYGDLFHANTPYLLTSVGSSGSDRIFLRAVFRTLAAFQPEVKAKLIEQGMLMPTVQAIFRQSYKALRADADYFTGKAHPSAYHGHLIDDEKMVRLAHAMTLQSIPPMVQLRVTAEDLAQPGRDYFEFTPGEKLFDTPAAIARLYRTLKPTYRIIVSAAGSGDVNGQPLKFKWAVLRGDPKRIDIRLLDKGDKAEITVGWHERMPVTPGDRLESNRVDIGVFATNGQNWSAPAFVTFFCRDDELRTYDKQGKLAEVLYAYSEPIIGEHQHADYQNPQHDVQDWEALIALLSHDNTTLGARLLQARLGAKAKQIIDAYARHVAPVARKVEDIGYRAIGEVKRKAQARQHTLQKAVTKAKQDAANAQRAGNTTAMTDARLRQRNAETELAQVKSKLGELDQQHKARKKEHDKIVSEYAAEMAKHHLALGGSIESLLYQTLNKIKDDPSLYPQHRGTIDAALDKPSQARINSDVERFLKQDILVKRADGSLAPVADLTPGAINELQWFNTRLMRYAIFPDIVHIPERWNFVDPRLGTWKDWRDVYAYDDKNQPIGWTRYHSQGKVEQFTAHGLLIQSRDALGRAKTAVPVRYTRGAYTGGGFPTHVPLNVLPDGKPVTYQYASDNDRIGQPGEAR